MKRSTVTLWKQMSTLFVLTTLMIFSSCKKNSLETTFDSQHQVEQFLKVPNNASNATKQVVNDLKRQTQEKNFVPTFVNSNGLPQWDKVIEKRNPNGAVVLYVPTKKNNLDEIAAFFKVVITNGKFGYELYTEADLSRLSGRKQLRNSQIAFMFAKFEKKINNKVDIIEGYNLPLQTMVTGIKKVADATTTNGVVFGKLKFPKSVSNRSISGQRTGDPFINDDDDDCCIEIWYNPDGDPSNNNGDEYYLYDDCSECEEEWEDYFVDGAGGGCPWYNPLCDLNTGGGITNTSALGQELDNILGSGDSYTFTNNLSINDVLVFNSLSDFVNYKNQQPTLTIENASNSQDLTKIEKAHINRTFIAGYNFFIKVQKKATAPAYSVAEITSSMWGFHLGWSFTMNPTFSVNTVGNVTTIVVSGVENYNVFIEGIGVVYADYVEYTITINNVTGTITSLQKTL